ncbi:hypothetical protein FQN54_008557 [Arachnomyces sp. PD_36]|nr:hypothetical protein FQN54_008557 [Arachnomyces sp. PD_36]
MEGGDLRARELRAAIAASLRQGAARKNGGGVVDLTEDSDDDQPQEIIKPIEIDDGEDDEEELQKALALSLQNQSGSSPVTLTESPKAPEPSGARYGIPGLDRKKQEEERLARLEKKRKATSVSPPPMSRELKAAKATPSHDHSKKNTHLTASHDRPVLQNTVQAERNRTGPSADSALSSKSALRFPTGTVKKTWAYGYPRADNDIKIEEVFQQSELEFALLSSFQWDTEWLFSKLDLTKNRCLLVMQAKDEETKRQYISETADMKSIRLCFPPMDAQVNCMHSKLMLLFYPNRLRIVVPSANLVPYDWGETGAMENTVFMIDLPRKTEDDDPEDSTHFYDDLVYFLRASDVHRAVIIKMSQFNFGQTRNIGFVHTVGGSHTDASWERTGLCGLGRTVKAMGLATTQPLKIDFVTSSVGSLNDEFLRSMYLAAQGDDGLTELTLRSSKKFPATRINDPFVAVSKETGTEWKDRFRVYFPSKKTVQESRGGPGAGGTICFQSKWYDGAKFPKHVLRNCVSRRPGILMHSKMLLARSEQKLILPDGSNCSAWAYVGSANLSESAWGRLVMDRTTKKPKLNCRNWECGVLLPISKEDQDTDRIRAESGTRGLSEIPKFGEKAPPENTSDDIDIASVFGDTVPVPMRVPASRFGPQDRPWFNTEY